MAYSPAMFRRALFPLIACLAVACAREPQRASSQTVRDDLGRSVTMTANVQRVITLAPNLTEMVYAIGAQSKLVATDDFSDYPDAAKKIAKVGGMQPNLEKIVSLHPDLVLATTQGNHPNLAPALAAANVPLYVVRADRLDQIPAALSRLATLLGGDARAGERLRATLAAQRRTRATKPRVLFAVWTNPIYVAGRDNFDDDLLALCGAENVVTVPGWPQYSLESLVASPPDVILYPDKSVTRKAIDELLAKGVKSEAIAVDENLFTRPGPRIGEAAVTLNATLDRLAKTASGERRVASGLRAAIPLNTPLATRHSPLAQ